MCHCAQLSLVSLEVPTVALLGVGGNAGGGGRACGDSGMQDWFSLPLVGHEMSGFVVTGTHHRVPLVTGPKP